MGYLVQQVKLVQEGLTVLADLMEDLYHEAVADLLEPDDIKYIIKLREIYRHLSNSADRGDRAAGILLDIVVKQA